MLTDRRNVILFAVNGMGLGNCTRCHAVIEKLTAQGFTIVVATSENGIEYFKSVDIVERVIELKASSYVSGSERFSFFNLLKSGSSFVGAGFLNARTIARALRDLSPKALIYDSIFNFAGLTLSSGPLISINNSDKIIASAIGNGNIPRGTHTQFFLVECFDYFFQRIVPALVISPWHLKQENPANPKGKIRTVGVIVRNQVLQKSFSPESTILVRRYIPITTPRSIKAVFNLPCDILGREGESTEQRRFWGKIMNNTEFFAKAAIVV